MVNEALQHVIKNNRVSLKIDNQSNSLDIFTPDLKLRCVTFKYTKSSKGRQRMFLKMVGEYGSGSFIDLHSSTVSKRSTFKVSTMFSLFLRKGAGMELHSPLFIVAFVKDNATMSSIRYFEIHASYFVQNRREYALLNSFLYDK